MIPVAHVVLFLAFGLPLELFAKTKPSLARQVSFARARFPWAIPELLLDNPLREHDRCAFCWGAGIAAS